MAEQVTIRATARHAVSLLGVCTLIFTLAGCGQSIVRPLAVSTDAARSQPRRILVYRFAADENQVTEYQGILRQQPNGRDPAQRRRRLADQAAMIFARQLALGLRELGLVVEFAERGMPIEATDAVIDGRFLRIDEGDPLKRFAVGLGSGASAMQVKIELRLDSGRQVALEFTTHSNSSTLPGALITAPISAAAPTAVGVGLAAGTAVSGIQDSTQVSTMATASADQAARYLSEFFARQRWIDPQRTRKARVAY